LFSSSSASFAGDKSLIELSHSANYNPHVVQSLKNLNLNEDLSFCDTQSISEQSTHRNSNLVGVFTTQSLNDLDRIRTSADSIRYHLFFFFDKFYSSITRHTANK
jgi:hypothetical protein